MIILSTQRRSRRRRRQLRVLAGKPLHDGLEVGGRAGLDVQRLDDPHRRRRLIRALLLLPRRHRPSHLRLAEENGRTGPEVEEEVKEAYNGEGDK